METPKIVLLLNREIREALIDIFYIPSVSQLKFYESYKCGDNIIMSGPAGCGKSHCINYIRDHYDNVLVTATTGYASSLIRGVTIDYYFNKWIRSRTYKNIDQVEPTVRTLIIDEASMLGESKLHDLDHVLRRMHNLKEPFGGIQIILSGDFLQLEPVRDTSMICSPYIINMGFKLIYMNRIFRQEESLTKRVLNEVRTGKITEPSYGMLQSLQDTIFPDDQIEPSFLMSDNKTVTSYNQTMLDKMEGETMSYEKVVFKSDYVKSRLPDILSLKEGAQVMLLYNINLARGLVNGRQGVVIRFMNRLDAQSDGTLYPLVKFTNGCTELITPYQEYKYISEHKEGIIVRYRVLCCSQIPLRLSWSITIHKSQGTTIDRCVIDCSKIFGPGQFYTALSRCRCLSNIKLIGFRKSCIKVNKRIIEILLLLIANRTSPGDQEEYMKAININPDYRKLVSVKAAKAYLSGLQNTELISTITQNEQDHVQLLLSRIRSKDKYRTLVDKLWAKLTREQKLNIRKYVSEL